MSKHTSSTFYFWIAKLIGFGLLFVRWLLDGGQVAGFFLFLFLVVLLLFRWRMPKLWATIVIDGILLLFFAEYLVLSLLLVSELFYRQGQSERQYMLQKRDAEAAKYYEMESLQQNLAEALGQVERMTAIAERTRIARDIHDNAGHEIVAAYISFQTLKPMLDGVDSDILELYDEALVRLDKGADKIREAVHNFSAVRALGAPNLEEICRKFQGAEVSFQVYGNSETVPMYVWNTLESCLNEGLHNIVRHAKATYVKVDIDVTAKLVRMCIENDGSIERKSRPLGSGLRNLRHRVSAVGGSLAAKNGEVFRLICVIPLKEEEHETVIGG